MDQQPKKLKIDFLYLDLSTCKRCGATDKVLDDALSELKPELKSAEVIVNKIKVKNDEEAKKYDFVRSPTIRINGVDIEKILTGELDVKDNYCESCASICDESNLESTGGGSQCRTVEYKGKTYEAVPKEMIKDAIKRILALKAMEGKEKKQREQRRSFVLPFKKELKG